MKNAINRMPIFLIIIMGISMNFLFSLQASSQEIRTVDLANISPDISSALDSISYSDLGAAEGKLKIIRIDSNTLHVTISFSLKASVLQDDWQVRFKPSFKPDFHWAPHLTPTDRNVIDQHVFRSPALMVSNQATLITIIPDIDILNMDQPVRWYMDLNAETDDLILGMSKTGLSNHVLYSRRDGAVYPAGIIKFGFYLMVHHDKNDINNPFRHVSDFFWRNWGEKLFRDGSPISGNLLPYVKHTYHWAFDSWKDQVWQEFQLNGIKVGAPTFIVNTTQSPNYPGEVNEREFRSIWNQAWFSSLRSASGLFRYARRTNNTELLRKANMTKELALAFPKKKGFFYGLIGTEMETVIINGKSYNRSKGWDTYYWGNSNRNPYTSDPEKSPFHVLDMSWTAYEMLMWYSELDKDARLLSYAQSYGDALLKIQFEDGFFPAWLNVESLKPMDKLNNSPETSMSVTFLLKLYQITHQEKYKDAALRALTAVITYVIPAGRWEDFETYWSCSRVGSTVWAGKKIKRNDMYKQNNFSMFWTAQALLDAYSATDNKQYLELGQRTLDELLMTQAAWRPNYFPINTFGGFGVMNADGEWDDSRQSLFSELIIKYGKVLNKDEYIQRGLAALRASFTMMYCPENPDTKAEWEKRWPFFGKEDYGFMMENFGHVGIVDSKHLGIGEFTIYDWGNGAASEAYNRIIDHYGENILNRQ